MNSQNKKALQVVLILVIAVVTLGIGYASISAINLLISGNATASVNDNNFRVFFVSTGDTPNITKSKESIMGIASISNTDNKVAMFDVSGLTKEGDYAIATYTILNNSYSIGAEISLELTNSNPEYFRVTETVTDNMLQAGDTTTGTIKVELIKSPVDTEVSTSVTGTLKATPKEDRDAVGGETKELVNPERVYLYYVGEYFDPYESIPTSDIYEDKNSAISNFGHPIYIRIGLDNNITKEVGIGFIKNNKEYFLKGYVKERDLDEKPVFESNKRTLIEAFGEENCYMSSDQFLCKDIPNGQFARADYSGWIQYGEEFDFTYYTGKHCTVNAGGANYCIK